MLRLMYTRNLCYIYDGFSVTFSNESSTTIIRICLVLYKAWGFFEIKTYCKLVVIIAEVVNCSKVKIIVIKFYVEC